MIQLMDTNKNWVDWKYFNANAPFKVIKYGTGNGSYTYEATANGMYILQGSGGLYLRSSTAQIISLSTVTSYGSYAFVATEGDTIDYYTSGSYIPAYIFTYLGKYEHAEIVSQQSSGNAGTATVSVTGGSDRVLIGTSGGTSVNSLTMSSDSRLQFISDNRVAITALIGGESGDATITVRSGSNGTGSAGFAVQYKIY